MLRTPDILLPDYMALHARARPGALALIGQDSALSWAELLAAMDRVAALLQARGIGGGDTVGVLGSLTPRTVAAQYGVLRAGAAIASLSTAVTAADLLAMVTDCAARAVIVSEPYAPQAEAVRAACPDIVWIAAGFEAPGWVSAWATEPAPAETAAVAGDVFSILYSSGTTSTPKGIVLTHASRMIYSDMLGAELGWARDAISLIATALHSNTSWSQLNLGFLMGGTAVLMAKFDAAAACDLVRRHRVSHTILVPAQYAAIVQQPEAADRLGSLRMACTVGSLMTADRKRALDAMLPGRSGDIGRFDGDGFLHLVDRKKDMIVSGAANTYPAYIERVLLPHPEVADACVIGVPHPRWDETPLALVVRRPDATIDAAVLLEWANAQLGRQQRLSAVEFRDGLPRNAAGKILKRELRAPYWPRSATVAEE